MFTPNGISGEITASATSQTIDLSSADPETGAVRLFPNGSFYRVNFGDSTVVATSTDMLLANAAEIFKIPAGATHVAVIGNSLLRYTIGQNA